jgi:hypothetical protein
MRARQTAPPSSRTRTGRPRAGFSSRNSCRCHLTALPNDVHFPCDQPHWAWRPKYQMVDQVVWNALSPGDIRQGPGASSGIGRNLLRATGGWANAVFGIHHGNCSSRTRCGKTLFRLTAEESGYQASAAPSPISEVTQLEPLVGALASLPAGSGVPGTAISGWQPSPGGAVGRGDWLLPATGSPRWCFPARCIRQEAWGIWASADRPCGSGRDMVPRSRECALSCQLPKVQINTWAPIRRNPQHSSGDGVPGETVGMGRLGKF